MNTQHMVNVSYKKKCAPGVVAAAVVEGVKTEVNACNINLVSISKINSAG
jgi:hypothetical protein